VTRTRFWYKVCIWKGTQQRGWQMNFLRNLTKLGVNKLFKKLRDTGTVDRRPGMADRTVPALKKTLSFFLRSFHSLPLTLFSWLSGEVTENTFSSVKKTKSVAYCRNFWSRSLVRFMRAVHGASWNISDATPYKWPRAGSGAVSK